MRHDQSGESVPSKIKTENANTCSQFYSSQYQHSLEDLYRHVKLLAHTASGDLGGEVTVELVEWRSVLRALAVVERERAYVREQFQTAQRKGASVTNPIEP